MNKEKLGLMLSESLELKYKAERADALARFAVKQCYVQWN